MTLSELLPISESLWQGAETLSVNARDLHGALDIGRDFSTWIKDRLAQADFVENQDFKIVGNLSSPKLGSAKIQQSPKARPQKLIDYWLSLDTAKHICLMERNNPIAHAIRQHFIDAEKELAKQLPLTAKDLRQRTQARIATIAPQKRLAQAITDWEQRNGKAQKWQHHSNEAEMLNSLVLGMNVRQWKSAQGVTDCPRNHFNASQLDLLHQLIETDCALLNVNMPFHQRKQLLSEMASRTMAQALAI